MLTIAHRGASAYAPENTAAAFDLAITMGAPMLETDVQLTRDGELVLFHDSLVNRTSNGRGPVADYSLAELQQLDLGEWFDARFAGERAMTLETFRTDYLPRIEMALEIKDPLACDATLEAIGRWSDAERARLHLTSFHWGVVLRAADAFPDVVAGFLCQQFDEDILHRCAARGIDQVCPPAAQLTGDLVERAHAAGLNVRAWGVKDRTDVDRLFDTGADGATCNWPDWMLDRA